MKNSQPSIPENAYEKMMQLILKQKEYYDRSSKIQDTTQ